MCFHDGWSSSSGVRLGRGGRGRRASAPAARSPDACSTGGRRRRTAVASSISWWAASLRLRLGLLVVGAEEVLRELAARERVEEQLGVVEVLAELAHDLVGLGAHVGVLLARSARAPPAAWRCRARAPRRRRACLSSSSTCASNSSRSAVGQPDLDVGHDLARALAHAHVADGVLARVAPVGVEARVLLVGRQHLQLLDHRADRLLADAGGEACEASRRPGARCAYRSVSRFDHLGDALRRHRADGQAVRRRRCSSHWPPTTSWKCGTRRPPTLRLTPKKPMSATWCWPHELKQPLTLMCRPLARSDRGRCPTRVSCLRSSPASPRDEEMPSLQVSVPGQAVMSMIVPAPGCGQADRLQRARRARAGRPRSPSAAPCSARRWCAACRRCTCARCRPARAPAPTVRSPSGSVMRDHRRSRPGAAG